MKKEQFSDMMNNIDDELIVNAKVTNKAKRKISWKPLGAIAACFCLVLTAIICIPMMNNDGKIIANYKTGEIVDAQYPIPLPGETIFFYEVEQARKEYTGKDVQFLVAFKVYKDGNDEISGEELNAEYQRLADLGYKLYHVEDHWTYRAGGVKEYIPIVVGLFTEDQLANFEANEMYGYTFYFETNGDGSSIPVDEKDAITNFNSSVA